MVNQDQTGLWAPNSAGKQKHTHQSFREMNGALPDLQRTSYLIKRRRKSYSKRHERGEEGGEKSQGGAYAKAIKTGDPDPV